MHPARQPRPCAASAADVSRAYNLDMAEQRRFRFKIIVSEDEAEDVLDALQGVLNSCGILH